MIFSRVLYRALVFAVSLTINSIESIFVHFCLLFAVTRELTLCCGKIYCKRV